MKVEKLNLEKFKEFVVADAEKISGKYNCNSENDCKTYSDWVQVTNVGGMWCTAQSWGGYIGQDAALPTVNNGGVPRAIFTNLGIGSINSNENTQSISAVTNVIGMKKRF